MQPPFAKFVQVENTHYIQIHTNRVRRSVPNIIIAIIIIIITPTDEVQNNNNIIHDNICFSVFRNNYRSSSVMSPNSFFKQSSPI